MPGTQNEERPKKIFFSITLNYIASESARIFTARALKTHSGCILYHVHHSEATLLTRKARILLSLVPCSSFGVMVLIRGMPCPFLIRQDYLPLKNIPFLAPCHLIEGMLVFPFFS